MNPSMIISQSIKLFFLFTPFFALSMFLTMTGHLSAAEKRKLVLKVLFSVQITCLILLFGGRIIFQTFGITVDAFRVGAGALLFLSAVDLVRGRIKPASDQEQEDIAVVPLSIPVIIGPATIGTLIVFSAELTTPAAAAGGLIALTAAILGLGLILFLSHGINRVLGAKGVSILSRLTGLILSALSAQMMLSGIKNFFLT